MALDILLIPAIFAKLKYMFLKLKITILDCRYRLRIELIEAL
jgi:hypothetical protein